MATITKNIYFWNGPLLVYFNLLHGNELSSISSRFFCEICHSADLCQVCIFFIKKVSLKSSTQKPDMRLSKLCVTPTLHPKWLPLLKVVISLNGKNRINWNLKFYVCSNFFSMKFKSNWKLHVGDGLQALLVFLFLFLKHSLVGSFNFVHICDFYHLFIKMPNIL